jgi:hypothetical protein
MSAGATFCTYAALAWFAGCALAHIALKFMEKRS